MRPWVVTVRIFSSRSTQIAALPLKMMDAAFRWAYIQKKAFLPWKSCLPAFMLAVNSIKALVVLTPFLVDYMALAYPLRTHFPNDLKSRSGVKLDYIS